MGRVIVFCSCARHFTLTVPLFFKVYKSVLAKFNVGGNPAMDWYPIQGRVEILHHATETKISSGMMATWLVYRLAAFSVWFSFYLFG